jgi:hypothetical protein
MSDINKACKDEMAAARREYLKDMKWLRLKFGIIPEAKDYLTKDLLINCLDALEGGTDESFLESVKSFKNFHKLIMKQTAWNMLEHTKNSLKAIKDSEPDIFNEKIRLWNRASWLFTNFSVNQSRSVGGNYRKALKLLTEL